MFPKRWFKKALKWAQDTGPAREDSIADMGMGHLAVRRMLGELGKRLVAGGAITIADGVYWLVEDEVNALAAMLERGESLPDYSGRIPHRKAEWRAQLKAVPPAMLPEKSRWASLIPWAKKVAREYGILAVMATGVATRRIKDEQMITVDGGAGPVTILSG